MSPMRETFTLDWDSPEEIELVKKFLKFHAKRLRCTEYEVLVKLAKELSKTLTEGVVVAEVDKIQILPKPKKKVETEE